MFNRFFQKGQLFDKDYISYNNRYQHIDKQHLMLCGDERVAKTKTKEKGQILPKKKKERERPNKKIE